MDDLKDDREYQYLQDCAICLTPFTEHSHQPFALKCGHIFGHCCISKWAEEKKLCPKCRRTFKLSEGRLICFPLTGIVQTVNEVDEITLQSIKEKEKYVSKLHTEIMKKKILLMSKQQTLIKLKQKLSSLDSKNKLQGIAMPHSPPQEIKSPWIKQKDQTKLAATIPSFSSTMKEKLIQSANSSFQPEKLSNICQNCSSSTDTSHLQTHAPRSPSNQQSPLNRLLKAKSIIRSRMAAVPNTT
ncbi:uncharacterized protein MONOS_17419 [Monocercomonoides exilis]|uniref:uncharacterized protein n=1 Tax=Monocercomonoides exilis TaxID=2049356 RepID=UPI003559D5A3|nr:hypothetical protein MONOS_17419 [Monocercomonoides exilis]